MQGVSSVPKTPAVPRLSIVVPLGANVAAFEDTLVSILQNRPAASEVVVAHDGSYEDPFNLAGEVRFVTAGTSCMIDLVAASASETRAKFVHVLAPGFQAIEDWTEPALDQFQRYEAAAVAPVIRRSDRETILAAGWHDTTFRLCQPVGHGKSTLCDSIARSIVGTYLQASFWRRDVLRSLTDSFESNRTIESAYAFGHMIDKAGWRTVLATNCTVTSDVPIADWDPSTYNRGRNLRAIRKAVTRSEKRMPLILNLLRGIVKPSTIAETFGQASFRGKMASTKRRLQLDRVVQYSDNAVITLPTQQRSATATRRAA